MHNNVYMNSTQIDRYWHQGRPGNVYSLVRTASPILCLACLLCVVPQSHAGEDEFPEQEEVSSLLEAREPPGVLFLVMEQDEDALVWVLPRILHYTQQLRGKWPQLPIAALSHGEEMLALVNEFAPLYPEVHRILNTLVHEHELSFHVCGTFAEMSGYADTEFSDEVDVVPFGPAQIENYRILDYAVISIELTW